jgi:hypothetical protein
MRSVNVWDMTVTGSSTFLANIEESSQTSSMVSYWGGLSSGSGISTGIGSFFFFSFRHSRVLFLSLGNGE